MQFLLFLKREVENTARMERKIQFYIFLFLKFTTFASLKSETMFQINLLYLLLHFYKNAFLPLCHAFCW